MCVCALTPALAAQKELSVAVVNGKGHLSLSWLATKTEGGSEEGGGQINLSRQKRVPLFFFFSEAGVLVAL